jgi:hypothetical protein
MLPEQWEIFKRAARRETLNRIPRRNTFADFELANLDSAEQPAGPVV